MWSPTQSACTGLSPTRCILFRDLHLPSEESEESYGSKRIYIVVRQWDFPPVHKQRRLQPGDTRESFSNLIERKTSNESRKNLLVKGYQKNNITV